MSFVYELHLASVSTEMRPSRESVLFTKEAETLATLDRKEKPRSACLTAMQSLAPSPAMHTLWPILYSCITISPFCSADTLPITTTYFSILLAVFTSGYICTF